MIHRSPMDEIQKNLDRYQRRSQKRRDVQDERNAGSYANGRDHYLDKDGHPLDGVEIPHWFKNLSKAWQTNKRDIVREPNTRDWDDFCEERIEMGITDPRDKLNKPKIGRPKSKQKIKRSEAMKKFLLQHDITVGDDNSVNDYDGWRFCVNGRLKYLEEDAISAHAFIRDYV